MNVDDASMPLEECTPLQQLYTVAKRRDTNVFSVLQQWKDILNVLLRTDLSVFSDNFKEKPHFVLGLLSMADSYYMMINWADTDYKDNDKETRIQQLTNFGDESVNTDKLSIQQVTLNILYAIGYFVPPSITQPPQPIIQSPQPSIQSPQPIIQSPQPIIQPPPLQHPSLPSLSSPSSQRKKKSSSTELIIQSSWKDRAIKPTYELAPHPSVQMKMQSLILYYSYLSIIHFCT